MGDETHDSTVDGQFPSDFGGGGGKETPASIPGGSFNSKVVTQQDGGQTLNFDFRQFLGPFGSAFPSAGTPIFTTTGSFTGYTAQSIPQTKTLSTNVAETGRFAIHQEMNVWGFTEASTIYVYADPGIKSPPGYSFLSVSYNTTNTSKSFYTTAPFSTSFYMSSGNFLSFTADNRSVGIPPEYTHYYGGTTQSGYLNAKPFGWQSGLTNLLRVSGTDTMINATTLDMSVSAYADATNSWYMSKSIQPNL